MYGYNKLKLQFRAAKVVIISELGGDYLHFGLKYLDITPFFRTFALRNETKSVIYPNLAGASGGHGLLLRETVRA